MVFGRFLDGFISTSSYTVVNPWKFVLEWNETERWDNLSLLPHLSGRLNRWQLCFTLLAVVYAVFLLLNLSHMSMQWDEVTHFTGGLLLSRGQLYQYVGTNSFYPPMFDLVTAGYFMVAGASVFAGRLVAVTFSLLSLLMVYKIANRMYGPKTALLSSVLFGVMPGFVWLSRVAMIETTLIFVFMVSMLFFFNWLRTHRDRNLLISSVAFVAGVLVKYQMLVAAIIMIFSILILTRGYLKAKIAKIPVLIVAGVAVAIAVFFVAYQLYASGILNPWIYAIQVGTADKSLYSIRFPTPIFYLIEMTWPYSNVHPISLFLYTTGLAGVGMFAYRRKPEDKFLLIWFVVIYVFFTLIPNRQWRYMTLLFPVLAISASSLVVSAYGKAQKGWRSTKNSLAKRRVAKLTAALLIVFTALGVFYSCFDAYNWVAKDQIQVPIEQATMYAAQTLSPNQSIMVVCPLNFFSKDMVWFYLNAKTPSQNQVWQYPELAVDVYTPNFNTTELMSLCQQHNVKYVLLYEYGMTALYFNTTLTERGIYNMLNSTGRFTFQTSFGTEPNRIFIMSFAP